MPPVADAPGGQEPPSLLIPEIRDYQKINSEIVALLDQGHLHLRLEGAEGQRLLASGLQGSWTATIEILGRTGPELAAGLNAPGLTIVARGSTSDGAGRGLMQGRLMVLGDAGDALGYSQSGGILVVSGSSGNRAGLRQSGGLLALLGLVGRLASDRQSGGILLAHPAKLGPHVGRGRTGGGFVDLEQASGLAGEAFQAWSEVTRFAGAWLVEPD